MSTRSRIGIIREQGSPPIVESIYCHFDGYPEGVGQTLLDHWTDTDKVNRLIALGDLSSLGETIGRKHDFDQNMGKSLYQVKQENPDLSDEEAEAIATKSRDESAYGKGWTTAYGRDRGEEGCDSRTHPMDAWPDYGQEAEYVFHPGSGKWWVSSPGQNPVGWNTVAAWHGFISIPDAIAIEQQNMARLG